MEAKKTTDSAAAKGPYFYAVGKRKTAIARVKLFPHGHGAISINERKFDNYFTTARDRVSFLAPFHAAGVDAKSFDLEIKLVGGGEHAGAEACRHGLTRALVKEDATRRGDLKKVGFLTRDSRIKERKKPGLKRARRAPQWSKR